MFKNNQFQKQQRTFDIMFRVVATFIAVFFVAIIAFWIFAGVTVVKAVDQVEEQGMKAVIERLWCGKDKQCL